MLKRSLRPRQIPLSTMQNGICEVTSLICNETIFIFFLLIMITPLTTLSRETLTGTFMLYFFCSFFGAHCVTFLSESTSSYYEKFEHGRNSISLITQFDHLVFYSSNLFKIDVLHNGIYLLSTQLWQFAPLQIKLYNLKLN